MVGTLVLLAAASVGIGSHARSTDGRNSNFLTTRVEITPLQYIQNREVEAASSWSSQRPRGVGSVAEASRGIASVWAFYSSMRMQQVQDGRNKLLSTTLYKDNQHEIADGFVTHYGESFNGHTLGCGGGSYSSGDDSILAVSPSRYDGWPCGTMLRVCGPVGCINGARQDACPACEPNQLDLSESGIAKVCGNGIGNCRVTIELVK